MTEPSIPAPTTDGPTATPVHTGHAKGSRVALAVGAVGVVFGDIGTSPLYAFRATFAFIRRARDPGRSVHSTAW